MEHPLYIYNTLTRRKEHFVPLNEPMVGMYVCGPTVYGDPHLGHTRPAITFDVLFRYLQQLGYKVRYVRNITDVGHLEHDADEGEDKIAKKARLEQLEPMEVAQYYTNRYHAAMQALNVLPPSIEPHATGHIIEQEELAKQIMENGYAYESNGSIYFDIEAYNRDHRYGVLSGRNLDDILNASRELEGVGEKRNQADFALWKKAQPEHIMRWPSPWSEGFPGWHCECTAMGRKYLGKHFDIHGGGMDLVFPHHECEIAQAVASQGDEMVRYWMHNNMITINATVIATLFDACKVINQANDGHATLSQADIDELKSVFQNYLFDVLGIRDDAAGGDSVNLEPYRQAVDLLLEMRRNAKAAKDWATSDLIRDKLAEFGFEVKDTKDGFEWKVK